MRKIKFRAFSKDTNKMVYPDDIGIFKEAYVGINGRLQDVHLGLLIQSHHEGVVVAMQYTGLKDKNGKEVYEGDVVDFCDFWGEITGGNGSNNQVTGVVKYVGSAHLVVDKNEKEYDLLLSVINDSEFEVIGNIYENPELLKEGVQA